MKDFFAKQLSFLMNKMEISKRALAKELGISRPSLIQLVNGKNLPSVGTLVATADFFHVSIDFLIGHTKLYSEPEGKFDYYVAGPKRKMYNGTIKYTFGIIEGGGNFPCRFLFIEELEGVWLEELLDDREDDELKFLALLYLLHRELGFEYDAFSNNGVDLLVRDKQGRYRELAAEPGSAAMVHPYMNGDLVGQWVKLPLEQKVRRLSDFDFMGRKIS